MTPAELAKQCTDRGLLTPELHGANDFYGHAAILKRYAYLPGWRSLKAAVEHSVMLHDHFWGKDLETQMPVFLCSSERRAKAYLRRVDGRKRAVAIGPMIHYALAGQPPAAPTERRLVVFPTHSTHHITASYDLEPFLQWVEEQARHFDRTVVCIYWKEVLAGLHHRFLERGLECVSAGHVYSPEFLPNLVQILGSATSIITNDVGSHLLYAVSMGKPVWVRPQEISFSGTSLVLSRSEFDSHEPVRRLKELFAEQRSEPSPDQRQYVYDLTGMAAVHSRAELYSLLMECEAEYRRKVPPQHRLRHWVRRGRYLSRAVRARLNGGRLPPEG